jgi:integrase
MRTPKYRRHSTRDLGFVEFHGRRTYFPGPYLSPQSVTAYRDFLNRHFYLPIEDERPAPPDRITVGEVVRRFLIHAERTYPVGTRSENANFKAALSHLLKLDADTLAADYGPLRLKALMHALATAKRSRGYVNSVAARVKRCFKWAASEEIVSAKIYHALQTVAGLKRGRSPAVERAPRQPVAWEHIEATLPHLSPTVAAMVLLQWYTGVRSGSICQAQADQFDTAAALWIWRPHHKTRHLGHELKVYIGPQAQKVLAPFMYREGYLFQPLNVGGGRSKGYRAFYDSVSYLRAVKRAIEHANRDRDEPIPMWTPHQIRHARGTLVRAALGLEAAQAALGHARMDATQLYAKRIEDLAKQVAKRMG